MLWDTTSHGFPGGQRAHAGDAWIIRIDQVEIVGNTANVSGIVVSDGGNNGDHTSNYVGTRVSFSIQDNGKGTDDLLNGVNLIQGNFTIQDRRVGAALHAESTGPGSTGPSLTLAEVQPLVTEAIRRWQQTGVDTSTLNAVDFRIADLGSTTVGLTIGQTILLDDDAAGWGWFVDVTPNDDSEFVLPGNQGERRRMDLLTVVMHELGHALGRDHDDEGGMAEKLSAGVRRTETELVPSTSVDQMFGQSGNDRDSAWLIAWLTEQLETTSPRSKWRR